MTLVVDPGLSTTQSYSSRADAIARAGLDLRGTTFLAITDGPKQEKLLAQASLDVDAGLLASDRFTSDRANDDQALEFPQGSNTTHPAKIVLATQLQAFHLAERESLGEIGTPIADASNVKKKKTGELEKEFFDRGPGVGASSAWELLPASVRGLLSAFLRSTSVAWSSGRVVRTS